MIKGRHSTRFLLKPTQTLVVLREIGGEEFQRDFSMKLRIFGQIDSAHATLTDQRNNLVMGYSLSRFELTIGQHLSPSLLSILSAYRIRVGVFPARTFS